jgi:hypothetical protein
LHNRQLFFRTPALYRTTACFIIASKKSKKEVKKGFEVKTYSAFRSFAVKIPVFTSQNDAPALSGNEPPCGKPPEAHFVSSFVFLCVLRLIFKLFKK